MNFPALRMKKESYTVQTCATGFVLGAVSVQQQSEDQDQDEDESHQSHDQQEPPLLVEGTILQRCRQREGHTDLKL